MSESPLSTYAGPIAVIAGGLFVYAGWMVISGLVGSRKKAREAAARRPGRHAA